MIGLLFRVLNTFMEINDKIIQVMWKVLDCRKSYIFLYGLRLLRVSYETSLGIGYITCYY